MTSRETIQSVKDYVLAGNKNLQVLDTLLNKVATSAVAEVPHITEDKKRRRDLKPLSFSTLFIPISYSCHILNTSITKTKRSWNYSFFAKNFDISANQCTFLPNRKIPTIKKIRIRNISSTKITKSFSHLFPPPKRASASLGLYR